MDQDFGGFATRLFVILSTKADWKESTLLLFRVMVKKLIRILDRDPQCLRGNILDRDPQWLRATPMPPILNQFLLTSLIKCSGFVEIARGSAERYIIHVFQGLGTQGSYIASFKILEVYKNETLSFSKHQMLHCSSYYFGGLQQKQLEPSSIVWR